MPEGIAASDGSFNPPKYICKIHGLIGLDAVVSFYLPEFGIKNRNYCLPCIAEMIGRHFDEVQELEEKKNDYE